MSTVKISKETIKTFGDMSYFYFGSDFDAAFNSVIPEELQTKKENLYLLEDVQYNLSDLKNKLREIYHEALTWKKEVDESDQKSFKELEEKIKTSSDLEEVEIFVSPDLLQDAYTFFGNPIDLFQRLFYPFGIKPVKLTKYSLDLQPGYVYYVKNNELQVFLLGSKSIIKTNEKYGFQASYLDFYIKKADKDHPLYKEIENVKTILENDVLYLDVVGDEL